MSEYIPSSTNINYWLNPNADPETLARQEAIYRRMGEMMMKTYWEHLHTLKEHTEGYCDEL